MRPAAKKKWATSPPSILKVTGPDGKDFTLFFDKESGLPVKLAGTVMASRARRTNMEITFGDYKDFDGIKKATKIEVKRNGETFQNSRSPSSRSWTRSIRRPSPSPNDAADGGHDHASAPSIATCPMPIHERLAKPRLGILELEQIAFEGFDRLRVPCVLLFEMLVASGRTSLQSAASHCW